MDEADYLSRIHFADQALLASARRLGRGLSGEIRLDEALAWPGALEILLCESTEAELLRIQYVTERYYGTQVKSAQDHDLQDELLALAYLRVVRLQFLRHELDMGFSKRQLRFVRAAVNHCFPVGGDREPRILEIGCGAGSLLESLAKSGLRSILGIDLAPSAVELARQRLAPYGLKENVHQATLLDLIGAGQAQSFDIVLLCDVIEHIPISRIESMLGDVRRLLRAGGHLVAVTPNAFAGPHDITRHFRAGGTEPEGLHLHEYSLRELTALLTKTGYSRLTGLRLRDCVRWPGEPRLSSLSVRFRMAVEPLFHHIPHSLTVKAVEKLYFSALCAQAAGAAHLHHGADSPAPGRPAQHGLLLGDAALADWLTRTALAVGHS